MPTDVAVRSGYWEHDEAGALIAVRKHPLWSAKLESGREKAYAATNAYS